MKSNKQKRAELAARRVVKRQAEAERLKRDAELHRQRALEGALERGEVAVNPARLVGYRGGYSRPEFLERGTYRAIAFVCKSCGKAEVWTARQQKWWYETAGGDALSTATRCRPCRAKERQRKAAARGAHAEGLRKRAAAARKVARQD